MSKTITLELSPQAVANMDALRAKLGLDDNAELIRRALATLHAVVHHPGRVVLEGDGPYGVDVELTVIG